MGGGGMLEERAPILRSRSRLRNMLTVGIRREHDTARAPLTAGPLTPVPDESCCRDARTNPLRTPAVNGERERSM